jgi:2-oxoglutarate dehydrogenase complex dehydrogenase (E1) component-like enzyme
MAVANRNQGAVPKEEIQEILAQLSELPEGFEPHPRIRALNRRPQALARQGGLVDWSTEETLAYATLLRSGLPVRLAGQDCERGTFGHRHAVLHDMRNGHTHTPLTSLHPRWASFTVCNSPLTETAVLAFEFGYSLERQDGLLIREVQFGDFANAAQVVIDQFIVSSEAKWGQSSNLCLLLPHGLEGQGPEHSSACPEHFLQLCAADHIEVIMPTTAIQLFHFLRRKAFFTKRRPAIVFTPKSFLFHKSVTSPLDELSLGRFEPILCDVRTKSVDRVLFFSGSIGAQLLGLCETRGAAAAVIRMEQLNPFPLKENHEIVGRFNSGSLCDVCRDRSP